MTWHGCDNVIDSWRVSGPIISEAARVYPLNFNWWLHRKRIKNTLNCEWRFHKLSLMTQKSLNPFLSIGQNMKDVCCYKTIRSLQHTISLHRTFVKLLRNGKHHAYQWSIVIDISWAVGSVVEFLYRTVSFELLLSRSTARYGAIQVEWWPFLKLLMLPLKYIEHIPCSTKRDWTRIIAFEKWDFHIFPADAQTRTTTSHNLCPAITHLDVFKRSLQAYAMLLQHDRPLKNW